MGKAVAALGLPQMAEFIGSGAAGRSSAEAAMAMSRKMALEARKEMPGPMSDADRDFLVSMTQNIGMTKEGRVLLAEVYKQRTARTREIAKHARDYNKQRMKEGGYFDQGFQEYLEDKIGGKSWFTSKMKNDLQKLTPASPKTLEEIGQLEPGQLYIWEGNTRRRGSK